METSKRILSVRMVYIFLVCELVYTTVSDFTVNAQDQKSWQWAKQIGSNSWDISAGIACDSKNNIYVAGSYFDTLNCDTKKVESAGSQDLFVAMFNAEGQLQEINTAGGSGSDIATCLNVTSDDNLVIGGILSDSAMFGKIKVTGNGRRLFITELDKKGMFIWVTTFAATGDTYLSVIGTDNQGNIYVSGTFSGSLEVENQKVTSKGKKDVFLARLSKSGTVEKLFSFGSEEDDSPSSLSVDTLGNIVIAGVFGKNIYTEKLKLAKGPGGTKTNVFIAMFDRDFNARWANVLPCDDYAQVASLSHDNVGNFYAAGSFSSRLQIEDTILVSKGYTDAFLFKYESDGRLEWARGFGSWYYDYANCVNIDNFGNPIITGSIGDTLVVDSLLIEPISKDNSALMIQFSPKGDASWADCISGSGRNFSSGTVLDTEGNAYFTGSFRDKFEKGGVSLTSFGDQDIFLAKYYNCLLQKAQIFGETSFCLGSSTELSVKRGFSNIIWNDTIIGQRSMLVNKPGLYWVSMLDRKGCKLTDTVTVEQNSLPLFSLGKDTTIQVSDSLMLHAPDKYPLYFWNDYSTGPEYLAKPIEGKPGTVEYWLTVEDSLSCNYTDTISITFLKDYDWVNLAKIQIITYPNPAADNVYWYLKTNETYQLVAELTDRNGRVLYHQFFKQYFPNEVKEINLGRMPSGIYNLRISNSSSGMNYKTVQIIKK